MEQYTIKVVKIESLLVDPSYQRGVQRTHKIIARDLRGNSLGVPVIGERDNGNLYIVDGLQRITALKSLGIPSIKVAIFASQGPEHEASVFNDLNIYRKRTTQREHYKSFLRANDPITLQIEECVTTLGFSVHKGGNKDTGPNRWRQLTCPGTLYQVCNMELGVGGLYSVLQIIEECWPDVDGTRDKIIGGLGLFLNRRKGLINLELLHTALKSTTAHAVFYQSKNIPGMAGGYIGAVCHVLERIYTEEIAKSKKKKKSRRRNGTTEANRDAQ